MAIYLPGTVDEEQIALDELTYVELCPGRRGRRQHETHVSCAVKCFKLPIWKLLFCRGYRDRLPGGQRGAVFLHHRLFAGEVDPLRPSFNRLLLLQHLNSVGRSSADL